MKDWLQFYFSFTGRATRYDFNMRFAAVAFIGSILVFIADWILQTNWLLSNLWNLLATISFFAVSCRRLHDMDHSGWWQVLIFFPFTTLAAIAIISFGIGAVMGFLFGGFLALLAVDLALLCYLGYFIMLSARRGTVGPNKYGADPLQTEVVDA